MSYELKSAVALAGGTCCYAGSRLQVRGPKRDLNSPYIAFLGGSEVFGRFVERPFASVTESLLQFPCLNLGGTNAGLDTFVTDDDLVGVAQEAELAVIQLLGAQNISNRFYRVHPRRNDRFLQAHPALKELYPEVDYTEFHFNKHLLTTLQALSKERFEEVKGHLQQTWMTRMSELISQLEGQVVLLWLDYDLDCRSSFSQEPVLVDRSMVTELEDKVLGLLELSVATAGQARDFENMSMGELDYPAAQHVLGPKEHKRIGCALAEMLQEFARGD